MPALVAAQAGVTVMAYDRPGHGESQPIPSGFWPTDWLRTEADRFDELLTAIGSNEPVLVGHSDGGSIALLHAAHYSNVSGVLAIAAHAWLENEAVVRIQQLRDNPEGVIGALGRHHARPEAVFEAWSGAWTSKAFESWDIRPELGAIAVPCHIVQGDADEYGTSLQATDTAEVIGANARYTLIAEGRHLLHHDQPQVVIDLAVEAWQERSTSD